MASTRRLEDRIRELAACLAIAPEDQLHTIMFALLAAIQECARRLENNSSANAQALPEFPHERRGVRSLY